MTRQEPDSGASTAADKALQHAAPAPLREALTARARKHLAMSTTSHDPQVVVEMAKGRTVGDLYLPANNADKKRFDEAARKGLPVAFDLQERGYQASDPVPCEYAPARKSAKPTLRPAVLYTSPPIASISLGPLPALLLAGGISGSGLTAIAMVAGATFAVFATMITTVVLLIVAASTLKLAVHWRASARRGLHGTFDSSPQRAPEHLTSDEQFLLDVAFKATGALQNSPAWRSETLAGPRAQINLREEAIQVGKFVSSLARLRQSNGERPSLLGDEAVAVWEGRQNIYDAGVASLRERVVSLVALHMAVSDIGERLDELNRLRSTEADDLAAQVVGGMPGNELAAEHLTSLTANASGVAEVLRAELTALTATVDDLARWATAMPELDAPQ